MDAIDEERASHPYVHTNCTDECKKRGCGKLYSFDGNWKLRYPVCMYRVPKEVTGFSRRLRYVDTCPNEPKFGHAFCEIHCTEAEKSNIPSKLREYLRYCGVLKDPDDDSSPNAEEISKLDNAEKTLSTRSSVSNASDCQGTASLLASHPELIRELDEENELDAKPECNKDTGAKKKLQKWSRGHFFVVRGGGHIDMWQPLYESEGPAQVFLIILSWMVSALGNLTRDERKMITLSYDNMCHIDCLHVARNPLPLPGNLSSLWLDVNKIIDSLHIKNHRDRKCHEKYHPKSVKDHNEAYNTMSCEQTFAWISRFKKIVCSMGKRHHHFYLHRMVKRRNKYIAFCYQHDKNPVQPKLH
ncbi:uncharacterized protein [Dysidea avara]|uniref:uncharacterized protein n=1 Tax=Dysidea avara TaxID=196820 RepID=UPI003333CF03